MQDKFGGIKACLAQDIHLKKSKNKEKKVN